MNTLNTKMVKKNMLVRIFATNKEIPEFPCLVGRQACLLTNRAALHPEADADGQKPRHSCEPVQTEVSYAGIYTLFCGKEAR